MEPYELYTLETATGERKKALERVKETLGFVPNLMAKMVESPQAVEAYMDMNARLNKTSFTPQELRVAYLALSRINSCTYCIAAHTRAAQTFHVPEEVIQALRNNKPIPDPRLAALVHFLEIAYSERGHVAPEELQAFFDAGYTKANAIEVLLIIASKVLSTFTDPIVDTEIDDMFKPFV